MTAMEAARRALQDVFGYDQFRPGQEDVIAAILGGRDIMAVMPTGAGKSLCYQIPGLVLPGITLVVSPLISLMRDQVTALLQNGVRAAYLNSSLTARQFALALQNNRLIALSGLIVGVSATFSMASSEFLAARSEGRSDALKSCSYTGIAYLITVVLLIAPYLLFGAAQYIPALICMLVMVVLIIAGFTYYTSVAQDQPFKNRFLEMALISIGVAVVSFVVGVLAKKFLGVDL